MSVPLCVKFPNENLGSPAKRGRIIRSLNKDFFNFVTNRGKTSNINRANINNAYREILPDYNIKVKKIATKDAFGVEEIRYDDSYMPLNFFVELPFKHGQLNRKYFTIMMHENTHILNTLTHPKYTARDQKILSNDKYNEFYKFYLNHLYCYEFKPREAMPRVEKETDNFLAGLNNEEQIDFLQAARYHLQDELAAYTEESRYIRKLKLRGEKFDSGEIINPEKDYMFTKKIEFLKQKIMNIIKQERAK